METFWGRPVPHHSPARPVSKGKGAVDAAFHEVFTHEPSTVKRAKVSGARKRKMQIAIALTKARQAGAKIPRK